MSCSPILCRTAHKAQPRPHLPSLVPSDLELDRFLRRVEQRAFRRAAYALRDEHAALDVVQEAMIRLARAYGMRPCTEWPMLFQRILTHAITDWFRRRAVHQAAFAEPPAGDGEDGQARDWLDAFPSPDTAETSVERAQWRDILEQELQRLAPRQRDAFLLRYVEELDVVETAAAMGCSEGSVKTHCARAIQSLARALRARGLHGPGET